MARIDFDGKQIDIPDFALEKTMQEVLRSLREEGVLVKQVSRVLLRRGEQLDSLGSVTPQEVIELNMGLS